MIDLNELFYKKNGVSFLDFENQTHEYDLPDTKIIQNILLNASKEGILITVVGDYDVDGQSSSAIAKLGLDAIGCEYSIRLPKRFSEGYGLSEKIIDEINEGIVLTFDNGIAAHDAINKAKEKGLTVIVTDHHLPQKDLGIPNADFVLDPHIYDDSFVGFRDYCGAGIAYRIFKDIVPKNVAEKMLQIATIATIADIVPLYGENRYIVKEGLKSLNNNFSIIEKNMKNKVSLLENVNMTKGLYSLLSKMNKHHYIEEDDIAFYISPALNAPGRLLDDGAILSMELLAEDNDFDNAMNKAEEIISYNNNRKEITIESLEKIEENIKNNCLQSKTPIIVYEKNLNGGLLGILAGKIAEKYNKPAIVLTNSNDNLLKGSGRSNGDFNLFDNLTKYKSYFVSFGGHEDACGLALEEKIYNEFVEKIQDEFFDYESSSSIIIDAEISTKDVSLIANQLKKFQPFGNGNSKFIFKIIDFQSIPNGSKYYDIKGENKTSLFLFGDGYKAVNFSIAPKYLEDKTPKNLILFGSISINSYYDEYRKKLFSSPQFQFYKYEIKLSAKKTTSLQERLKQIQA